MTQQNSPVERKPEEYYTLFVSGVLVMTGLLMMAGITDLLAHLVRLIPGLRPNAPRRNALVVLCYLVFALFVIGLILR